MYLSWASTTIQNLWNGVSRDGPGDRENGSESWESVGFGDKVIQFPFELHEDCVYFEGSIHLHHDFGRIDQLALVDVFLEVSQSALILGLHPCL